MNPTQSNSVMADTKPSDAEIHKKLDMLEVGGCTCQCKSPEIQYHAERCHYRLASEIRSLLRGSAAAPAAPASPEARDALQASTGRVSEFEALMRLRWLKSLIETRQDANRYSYGRVDPETGAWEGPEWVDTVHEALDDLYSAAEASKGCRFQETWCSQCGTQFGPGDGGYGHCTDHAAMAASKEPQA